MTGSSRPLRLPGSDVCQASGTCHGFPSQQAMCGAASWAKTTGSNRVHRCQAQTAVHHEKQLITCIMSGIPNSKLTVNLRAAA